ncbi:MAG: response regulator [Armatimonadota bacterium]|nr:MAG: response regulator [Armatimonadota bacterium]
MPEPFELSRFLQTFVTEARERLARVEQGLMRLEREPENQELFNELLREAHTLKGSARMIGLMKVDALAHRLEEVVSALRDAAEPPSRQAIDTMLEATDALKALVEEAANGPEAPDTEDLVKRMARWGGSPSAPAPRAPAAPEAESPPDARARSRAQRSAGPEHTVRVEVAKLEKLSNLSLDLVSSVEQAKRTDQQLARAVQEMQRLQRALAELAVRMESAERTPLSAAAAARDLAAAVAQQRGVTAGLADLRQAFQAEAHRASLVIDELRELAIDLHMLPISTVFDAFPRAARDLATEYDKEIQFIVEGGEAHLDKKIIEEIGEPLLHLLRNAVAHGIEEPERRERAGKPRAGVIQMTATTRANHIVITVRDDGAGVDVEALKANAVERGLVDAAAAEHLTRQQALELAFLPGVTTTRMITDVSGRGMGMDVVRAVARRLNGTVTIVSHEDAGCTVTLELPLTLAIMHVILVRAGGLDMAMPSSFVRSIVTAPGNGDLPQAVTVEDETLPVVSLAGIMELAPTNGGNGHRRQIVSVQAAGEGLGLAADEVLDEREVILRPLGPHFSNQRKVMAATMLGDGEVVPILDIPGLVEVAQSYQPERAVPPVQPRPRQAVLLVEDSVITADLERAILEQAGYEVVVAGDGLEALARLSERAFNLIVADLEMPHMDGFALLERVRDSDKYGRLPVVVVTSRQSLEDKRRGLELGANAYITKGTFDQNVLLETIERLIG